MSVTEEQVAELTGLDPFSPTVPILLQQALTLVSDYLGVRGMERISDEVYDWAVLQVSGDLQKRRSAPGGNLQYTPGGEVAFVSSDPLVSVKPVIKRYKGFGSVG